MCLVVNPPGRCEIVTPHECRLPATRRGKRRLRFDDSTQALRLVRGFRVIGTMSGLASARRRTRRPAFGYFTLNARFGVEK